MGKMCRYANVQMKIEYKKMRSPKASHFKHNLTKDIFIKATGGLIPSRSVHQ